MPLQTVNAEMVGLLRPFFMDNILERDSDTYNDTEAKVLATDSDGGVRVDHIEVGNVTGAAEGELALAGQIIASTAIGARVYNSATIAHTSTGNWQTLAFDSERWDTDACHNAGSLARLTAQTAGVYLIIGMVSWAADADGQRMLRIELNDTSTIARVGHTANADGPRQIVTTLWLMAAADYVTLMAYQNSGGNLNMNYEAAYSPEFMMVRIA
jgi:hypothetical protein